MHSPRSAPSATAHAAGSPPQERAPGRARLLRVLEHLEAWGARRGWIGADPYEGLNSALGRIVAGRHARRAVIQLYRRLPVSPPWPLRATPMPNAKALALVLSGYSTPAGRRLRHADEFLTRLPSTLERMNLLPDGAGWGYPFDVVTRNISYDRSTPNAIATCFVVGALIDAYQATGERGHADLALGARPFLMSLLTETSRHGPFFAYVHKGSDLVHNANLLVCGALARLDGIDADASVATVVERAAATTLSLQREDGLWPYGESPNYRWTDNFHTAYVLDGLGRVCSAFGLGRDELERGTGGWRKRFLEPDGWARYYPHGHFPLEAHCCASAIDLLCAPGGHGDVSLAERVAHVAIGELWLDGANRFALRRTRLYANRRELMRWTNAPMFHALGMLSSATNAGRATDSRRAR